MGFPGLKRESQPVSLFSLLFLSCFSSPPWAANTLGSQELLQAGTDCPLTGRLPQFPGPGMALQQAGLSLVAARGSQPRVCSRTSCGGSLWRPKSEANGVGK